MRIRPLPPKLQETAEKELNEDPNRLIEDLQHIQEWIEQQPHLNARKDPQFLLSFLRSSKLSLQRTKEKLDYFYTIKTLAPEVFMNRDPFHQNIQDILDTDGFVPLTKSTAEAGIPTILLLRWKAFDPDKHHYLDILRVGLMYLDVFLNEDDNCIINGMRIIEDTQGFPLGYLKQLTLSMCKKTVLIIQNAYPIRLKGVDLLNTPAAYEIVVNMCMPFFSEKLKSRLKVLRQGAIEQLYQYVPQEVLPGEYGGKAGPISRINGEFRTKLEKYRDWFIEDEQYGSDENKRSGEPVTSADMFGVEGSFRKLNID